MTITEIVLILGVFVLMVGVGASCKIPLVRKMLKSPKARAAALVGVCCQFVFMPIVAYLLILIFRLKSYTALGVALAAAMPGGSSSNVFTMWAQGVLELSVFMTIFSTIAAFGLTPLWLIFFTEVIDGVNTEDFDFASVGVAFALLVIPISIGFCLNFVPCMKKINFEKPLSVFAIIVFVAVVVLLSLDYPDAFTVHMTWQIVVAACLYFPVAASLSWLLISLLNMCVSQKFSPAVKRQVVFAVSTKWTTVCVRC